MKRIYIALSIAFSICTFCFTTKADPTPLYSHIPRMNETLPDGTYKATVEYYNYATSYSNTYSLKVVVSYGSITAILFPNGGSVHTGYNNEGYAYSGGFLTCETDYSTGGITSATALVSIIDNDGTKTFKISIN